MISFLSSWQFLQRSRPASMRTRRPVCRAICWASASDDAHWNDVAPYDGAGATDGGAAGWGGYGAAGVGVYDVEGGV